MDSTVPHSLALEDVPGMPEPGAGSPRTLVTAVTEGNRLWVSRFAYANGLSFDAALDYLLTAGIGTIRAKTN